ncbi:haloacid dehalogenase [Rhodoblastus sphagnicola]|uniref:phosphoglycolate phosphatase n=1 Tax=Rhodoblastus sphagnicola TaxID=333368 RepID=A0A2S6MVR1_9HYPH|nr:HAD family hydrolase [Rhodoblastus sphagnicola]MBB4198324.1 putative hydrolase of the HAD superfamily [Rhodoblastus sphagnicola]PPQ26453.1 haloacid dehalogenase [Rhodoblastus sphagnicola]
MTALDWSRIRLVAFDVDGTLYDQRALRLRMAWEIASHALATQSMQTLRILRRYRSLRETLGDAEIEGFEPILIARTAREAGVGEADVRGVVGEWIERRPLAHLAACRYAGVRELFLALKSRGILIGVYSDYPAREKLEILQLRADLVACATDTHIGVLKPNPRGLQVLMREAGVAPEETLMVGDRVDRDAEAARRAGALAAIRSSRRLPGLVTFANYTDKLFPPALAP